MLSKGVWRPHSSAHTNQALGERQGRSGKSPCERPRAWHRFWRRQEHYLGQPPAHWPCRLLAWRPRLRWPRAHWVPPSPYPVAGRHHSRVNPARNALFRCCCTNAPGRNRLRAPESRHRTWAQRERLHLSCLEEAPHALSPLRNGRQEAVRARTTEGSPQQEGNPSVWSYPWALCSLGSRLRYPSGGCVCSGAVAVGWVLIESERALHLIRGEGLGKETPAGEKILMWKALKTGQGI